MRLTAIPNMNISVAVAKPQSDNTSGAATLSDAKLLTRPMREHIAPKPPTANIAMMPKHATSVPADTNMSLAINAPFDCFSLFIVSILADTRGEIN